MAFSERHEKEAKQTLKQMIEKQQHRKRETSNEQFSHS